jgi:murein DD-endopeptidase MepM/ murein hydrolase activator NlpD
MNPFHPIQLILPILLLVGWKGSCVSGEVVNSVDPLLETCERFKTLYQSIGDSSITPDSAAQAFSMLFLDLKRLTAPFHAQYKDDLAQGYIFPVRGYTPASSIGGRGRGYRPDGFDFFDSRVRKSHPAHDLFIRDRNNDAIDDIMCEPVDVLAFTGGFVLGTKDDWKPESQWRGGNVVWIYNPFLDALMYYAHNSTVEVKPGQWVKAGDVLGKMGRTGFNAQQARSTTHLHFMYLSINEKGLPELYNPYQKLLSSKVIPWED